MQINLDALVRAGKGKDLIVSSSAQFAASSAAEILDIPFYNIALNVQLFPSVRWSPLWFSMDFKNPIINAMLWSIQKIIVYPLLKTSLNKARSIYGLQAIKNYKNFSLMNTIYSAPKCLFDSPKNTTHISYLHHEDTVKLRPETESFIKRYPNPIFIGFGSMVETKGILEIIENLSSSGIPVIWQGTEALSYNHPLCLGISKENHSALFKNCRLIVHHGGLGTFTTAARSGVPQLIIPHYLDQKYNGRRMSELGLGPKPTTFKNAINTIMSTLENKDYIQNAEIIARKMQIENGIEDFFGLQII